MGEIPHDWAELADDAPWWAGAGDLLSSNAVVGFGITAAPAGFQQFTPGAGAAPSTGFGLVAAISGAPGFSVGAAAPAAPGFTVSGAVLEARRDTFNEFIQWRLAGVDLGGPTVQVIDIIVPDGGFEVTRGVGDNAHVLTIKQTSLFAYYTSILYPTLTTDAMSVALPTLRSGTFLGLVIDSLSIGLPTLRSGTLASSITFVTYDPRAFPDTMTVALPTLQSGTLVVTISYLTYDRRTFPDTMTVALPTIQSGTLVVTISYVNYTNPLTYVDTMSIALPTLQSGTLV